MFSLVWWCALFAMVLIVIGCCYDVFGFGVVHWLDFGWVVYCHGLAPLTLLC